MPTDSPGHALNAEVVSLRPATGPRADPAPERPAVIRGDITEHAWHRVPERRPVLPAWVRDAGQRRAAASWAAVHAGHVAAFHAVRIPLYLGQQVARSPRGLGRALYHGWAWAFDREAHPLRVGMVEARDAKGYANLARIRKDRVRHRLLVIAAAAAAAGTAAGVAAAAWPPSRWLLLAAAVLAAGYAGRPAGRPVIPAATVSARAERLTPDIIVRALGSLSLSGIDRVLREGRAIAFTSPVVRDGPGWRVELDLPYGTTVTEVIDRREKLASGLRRPVGCVWPEPADDEHAGRLVLYVSDVPLAKAKQAPWPLLKAGRADLFAPVPFGIDQRGRPVTLTLMYAAMLVGSIPRMGKTAAMLLVLLAAALDPRAELRIWELKGTGDLDALEKVAYRFGSGADDDTIAAAAADLRDVAEHELIRRAAVIRGLPAEMARGRKVTPELAGKRSLRLHPMVIAVDEAQELFSHPGHGADAARFAEQIVKRGPALGIMLIVGTQRPDAKSMPTGVSANVVLRFCLKVMGQVENDMILGTSSYRNGIRATQFAFSDKGIGWLGGAADDVQVARTYYVDQPAADKVADRARLLREAAGTITGYAAGEQPAAAAEVSLLADVAAVLPEAKHHLAVIAARLAELRPHLYGGWDERQARAALRAAGVTVGQVWADGANRNGIDRDAVLAAIAGSADA